MFVSLSSVRGQIGRQRPDIAAWFSFDGDPLTFSRTYHDGNVGPFTIGTTREEIIVQSANLLPFPEDHAVLASDDQSPRVAVRAKSGGYAIHTMTFENGRLARDEVYFSIFAGL